MVDPHNLQGSRDVGDQVSGTTGLEARFGTDEQAHQRVEPLGTEPTNMHGTVSQPCLITEMRGVFALLQLNTLQDAAVGVIQIE